MRKYVKKTKEEKEYKKLCNSLNAKFKRELKELGIKALFSKREFLLSRINCPVQLLPEPRLTKLENLEILSSVISDFVDIFLKESEVSHSAEGVVFII